MIFCSFINGIHPSTHVFTHMFSPRGSYDRLCGAVATLLRPHWLGRVSGDPLPPGAGLSGVLRAPVSSTLCPATRKLSLQHRADHGLSCSQPFQGSSCPCDKARCPGARPAPPSSLRAEPLLSPLFSAWTLECVPGARPASVQSQGGAPPVTAGLRTDPGVRPGSPAPLRPVFREEPLLSPLFSAWTQASNTELNPDTSGLCLSLSMSPFFSLSLLGLGDFAGALPAFPFVENLLLRVAASPMSSALLSRSAAAAGREEGRTSVSRTGL